MRKPTTKLGNLHTKFDKLTYVIVFFNVCTTNKIATEFFLRKNEINFMGELIYTLKAILFASSPWKISGMGKLYSGE